MGLGQSKKLEGSSLGRHWHCHADLDHAVRFGLQDQAKYRGKPIYQTPPEENTVTTRVSPEKGYLEKIPAREKAAPLPARVDNALAHLPLACPQPQVWLQGSVVQRSSCFLSNQTIPPEPCAKGFSGKHNATGRGKKCTNIGTWPTPLPSPILPKGLNVAVPHF